MNQQSYGGMREPALKKVPEKVWVVLQLLIAGIVGHNSAQIHDTR